MKIAIHGATGRMGRALALLCQEAPDLELVGAVAHAEDPNLGKDIGELSGSGHAGVAVQSDVASALLGADVAIDFSLPQGAENFVRAAVAARIPFVMGTTGLSQAQAEQVEGAARSVPFLWAHNMSLGIHVLAELVRQAVRQLGTDFDVEIVDIHHRHKVDSPSGTALRLADAVSQERPEAKLRLAREGQVGARTHDEVGIFGVRGGEVIGDHTVYLLGPSERIELTHRATNRAMFAHGALRAARWLVGKPPGRYTIADVLA